MKTNMYAYQILARIQAGLQLCGQEEDGTLMWMGTTFDWARVNTIELYLVKGI